jgi:hypothetical protein
LAIYFTGCGIEIGSVQMIAVFEEQTGLSGFVMGGPSAAFLGIAKSMTLICRSS